MKGVKTSGHLMTSCYVHRNSLRHSFSTLLLKKSQQARAMRHPAMKAAFYESPSFTTAGARALRAYTVGDRTSSGTPYSWDETAGQHCPSARPPTA
jgi:hypothetical protein